MLKKKVQVAIIDTGLDDRHKDFESACIEKYYFDNQIKAILKDNSVGDKYGHGTACAWIIHNHAPECKIISIRVLDSEGVGELEGVIKALEWCLDNKIDIVNLSLGTYSNEYTDEFRRIGELAKTNNILISAAYGELNADVLPARLKEFYGVKSQNMIGRNEYYFEAFTKTVYANGGLQRIGWPENQYVFLQGNSFANANFSGIVAHYKIQNDQMSVEKIVEKYKKKVNMPVDVNSQHIEASNSTWFNMGKVLAGPFTKELHGFFNFPELAKINISGVFDVATSLKIGKNVFDLLSIDTEEKLIITTNIENIIDQYDTLLISRTHMLEKYYGYSFLEELFKIAIEHGKNVYSLEYIDCGMFPDLFEKAKKNGSNVRHPILFEKNLVEAKSYIDLYGRLSNNVPIIGVFGTGTQQGKFTVQLMLRSLFRALGYKVFNLGTEIESELYGFEGFYPMEIESSIKFDKWEMIDYLQGTIRKMELSKPDLIVVGSQSGVIPCDYYIDKPNYTLPSIAFLMGTLPHCYILTFNVDDDMQYIQETIDVLEKIGKAKVILLVFSNRPRRRVGRSKIYINRKLSIEETDEIIKKFEGKFHIPTTEIISSKGKKIMMNTIFKYFNQLN